MYFEKATQCHSGEYAGSNNEGNLYKGIIAFMIVGLKDSISEVKFGGEWLPDKMSNCTDDLTSAEFCVRGIFTDNDALNVHAFSSLTAIFNSDSHQYINHPENFGKKTYLFYDTVHIMKNIRNNLLNSVRNSSRQSANAEAFAEVYLHFIVFASAIKMPRQLNS